VKLDELVKVPEVYIAGMLGMSAELEEFVK